MWFSLATLVQRQRERESSSRHCPAARVSVWICVYVRVCMPVSEFLSDHYTCDGVRVSVCVCWCYASFRVSPWLLHVWRCACSCLRACVCVIIFLGETAAGCVVRFFSPAAIFHMRNLLRQEGPLIIKARLSINVIYYSICYYELFISK